MMEYISYLEETNLINVTPFESKKISNEMISFNNLPANLAVDGGENYYHYLNYLGLANDPKLLVLPSRNHYFYDYNDLKDVTTVVNLKKLNMIRHLDSFLQTVYNVLSPDTNFIGCFTDRKNQNGIGLHSRILNGLINFLDLRTDIKIDKKDVLGILKSHGFIVVDMTEIQRLTYFRTQKKWKHV